MWCYFLVKYDFVYLGKWGPQYPKCLGFTATRVLFGRQPPECCRTYGIQIVMGPRAFRVSGSPQYVESYGAHRTQSVVGPTASRVFWDPQNIECYGSNSMQSMEGPIASSVVRPPAFGLLLGPEPP